MTSVPTDILCGEIGAPDAERWSAPVADLSPQDRAALESLEASGFVELRPSEGARDVELQVAGTDHVGLLALPTGRRLHIRPKVPDLVLLDWLAYVGDCPPPSPWLSSNTGLSSGHDFHALLAALLLHELEQLTRAQLRKDYVTARSDGGAVRGRVLAGAVARGYHRLPAVPHAHRVRSLDTVHNRILAAAFDRLPTLLRDDDPGARARWSALRYDWSDVPRDLPDLPRALADGRSACPPGYAPAVQLASLLLSGGAATATPPAPSTAGGPAFLLSLSSVWERALRKLCGGLAADTGWNAVPDADRTKHWHDGPGLSSPARWMTADVLLQTSSGRRWVLDAKYKRDYGREDRHDRYQATAYAMAFGAERGSLVYPTAEGTQVRWRVLLNSRVGRKKHVVIESIEVPMSAGPQPCRAALLDLIRGVRAKQYEQLPLFL